MLRVPPDALPQQVQALIALLSGRCGAPPLPGQRSSIAAGLEDVPPVGDLFFLRCVHLNLSGHTVPTALLRELLATGPARREAKSLTTLRGLELQGCQLAAGAAGMEQPGFLGLVCKQHSAARLAEGRLLALLCLQLCNARLRRAAWLPVHTHALRCPCPVRLYTSLPDRQMWWTGCCWTGRRGG